jgi:hypothetical protein
MPTPAARAADLVSSPLANGHLRASRAASILGRPHALVCVDLDDFAILVFGDGAQFTFLVGAGLAVGRQPRVDGDAAIALIIMAEPTL